MATLKKGDVLKLLGSSPGEVAKELHALSEAAKVLSSDRPRLIDQYPLQWVGVYEGRVAAHATTIESLLTQLEQRDIPSNKAIIRFIDKEERILIL
jgi:hypothetical protein